jgi:hypothetical protein
LGEVVGAQLEKIGNQEEATSAGGGQAAFEQDGDIVLDVVAGDEAWARLASAVEDVDLLFGEEPRRQWRGFQRFFFLRP